MLVGQSRTPIGIDGSLSQYSLPFVFRSQIARNFSNIRAMSVKSTGSYKYADYNVGFYDSTRLMQDFFEGTEFTGWVNLKPLTNSEKYGKLVTGTGVNTGKRYNSYTVLGTYVGYEYKNSPQTLNTPTQTAPTAVIINKMKQKATTRQSATTSTRKSNCWHAMTTLTQTSKNIIHQRNTASA